ncbi:MAG TPA: flagellar hook-basal body protein [Fimbriimonas sp.]|nr:flagellar hook-basal body protein [Fimbriimonas sp.]
MNRGIDSLATGMLATQQAMDVVSNNLANVNTTGFKADGVSFNDALIRQMKAANGAAIGSMGSGGTIQSQFTDASQGSLKDTGNNLDFALQGPGMFAVQGPGGQIQYTRNGAFTQTSDGSLVTTQGYPVLDSSLKPVKLRPGAFSVSPNGDISSTDGSPSYGSIGIFNGSFTKAGNFSISTNAAPQTGSQVTTKLRQGSLESSNVNAITSMVDMISLQRTFDMAQKSIMSEDDMSQKLTTVLTS